MADATAAPSETKAEPAPASAAAAAAAEGTAAATPAEVTRSLELKDKGNAFFKEKKFRMAIEAYTEAIALNPTAALYGNRAFANLKIENFGTAIEDADEALALDETYMKGYYRKGSALLALGRHAEAKSAFYAVAKARPQSRDARAKLEECNRIIRQEAFAKAIAGASAASEAASSGGSLDWRSMALPEGYDGPTWSDDNSLSVDFVKEAMQLFKKQKMLPKRYVARILADVRKALRALPTLVDVQPPAAPASADAAQAGEEGEEEEGPRFNICGDTHGQYYDLLNIFEINGLPSVDNPYLFNGDFVDRGSFGVENVLTLFMWKLAAPSAMFLNRGNHETVNMNKMYGFEGEVAHKLEGKFMAAFTEAFQSLPLAHVVGGKVLVVHGGLPSTDGHTLDEIRGIDRFQEPPEGSLFNDLLWTDPQPFMGRGPSKRGLGKSFGPDITAQFLKENGLTLLVRSHEVRDDGYLVEHDGKCVTVFSAPNYCDEMGNWGGIVRLDAECKPTYKKFKEVPHPPVRPMAYSRGLMSMFGLA